MPIETSPPRRHTSPAPLVVATDEGAFLVIESADVARAFVRPASRVMARYLRACHGLTLVGWDERAAAWIVEHSDGRREHRTEDEAREYLVAVARNQRLVRTLTRMRGAGRGTAGPRRPRRVPTHRATRAGRVTTRRRTTSHAASSAGGGRDEGGGEPPPPNALRVALADSYRFERSAPAGGAA